jgi:hypothetical protein
MVYPSGVQLVTLDIAILQRHQNKVLRPILNAPWYKPDKSLRTDLNVPTTTEGITKFSVKYRDKITTHPNKLASKLLAERQPRRLKLVKPTEVTTRLS